MSRFLLAMFQQESNSFSPMAATMERFQKHCLFHGEDMLKAFEGTRTELGGFIKTLRARGEDILPSVAAGCVSCGAVTREVFGHVLERVIADYRAAGSIDCVLLCLHGAMLYQDHPDGTGYFLESLRQSLGGDALIAATLDFHANPTERMLKNADILVGYKTYPHIDLSETGERAAALALDTLEGKIRPVMRMRKLPMILNSEASQTTAYPMRLVADKALEIEKRRGVLSASVFQVQPWLNTEDVGCSCLVMTDGGDSAEALSDELGLFYWCLRREFRFELTPLERAVELAYGGAEKPVLLADSADGNGSGSPGDSPAILREMLRQGYRGTALLSIVDPNAVKAAARLGIGGEGELTMGGGIDRLRHDPITVRVRVKTLSDGRFVFKGPQSTGQICEMGLTAVVQTGNISIVLMENSVNNWDPALYRSLGLEPTDADAVVVKSPAAFRAAYESISQTAYLVDAPGASSANLNSLPFDKIPRPLYPFDDFEIEKDE